MIVDCISDLHGHYPNLDGGDLLIVAGDMNINSPEDGLEFREWLSDQDYKRKIYIAGNHDNWLVETPPHKSNHKLWKNIDYLRDSGTEFEGLQIWGSPWIKRFEGMNPCCMAFTLDSDLELKKKWDLIPNDIHIDILITHSPPYKYFDYVKGVGHTGSETLLEALRRIRPKLHVFGHIHEEHGWDRPYLEEFRLEGYPIMVNASYVNERYKPDNESIRIEL